MCIFDLTYTHSLHLNSFGVHCSFSLQTILWFCIFIPFITAVYIVKSPWTYKKKGCDMLVPQWTSQGIGLLVKLWPLNGSEPTWSCHSVGNTWSPAHCRCFKGIVQEDSRETKHYTLELQRAGVTFMLLVMSGLMNNWVQVQSHGNAADVSIGGINNVTLKEIRAMLTGLM